MVQTIIRSETRWLHLIFIILIEILVAAVLYTIVIPISFFSLFGEGDYSARIGSLPLTIFIGEWLPLIVVLIASTIGIYWNTRKKQYSPAKSYLLAAVIVSCLYLFREHLLDIPYELPL